MSPNNIFYDNVDKVLNANFDIIDKICYPLFKTTPVNDFEYTRFYDSGEIISLTTKPDVVVSEYKNHLLPTLEELTQFSTFGLRMTFLSHQMPLPPGADEMDPEKYQKAISNGADYQRYHLLCFVDRINNYYRICSFSTTNPRSSIFNFYLNAISVLDNFINYFEIEAEHLLTPNNQFSQLILPYYLDKKNNLPQEKTQIVSDLNIQTLTLRERDCLKLVGQGYTMKNIGKQLKISPRTVEQHLRNIKDKYGVNTKNQLVEIWHDHYKFSDVDS